MTTSNRRWLRYRLRSLLIVLTVIGVYLGWQTERARRQHRAVTFVTDIGGSVQYDESSMPKWICELVGETYLLTVEKVHLGELGLRGGSVLDDALLDDVSSKLNDLPDIQWLELYNNPINGNGLKHLPQLGQLEVLLLSDSDLDDASLEHISHLKSLRILSLQGTQVSDGGLEHLTHLSNLVELHLTDTHVTESGVLALGKEIPACGIRR